MPDIASVLKEEITRLARKELKSETEGLKKSLALQRSEIAALKRRVTALEQQIARLDKKATKATPDPVVTGPSRSARFSAKGLRALRKRLDMSAPEFAVLIGVSSQTIYNWEAETSRPREQQIAAIAALRGIGKREARARLVGIEGQCDDAS